MWTGEDERVFITNALDWEIRGNDPDYRVEIDIGAYMTSWLRQSATNDLLFGIVHDKKGGPRRPVLILGLLRAPSRTEMGFERVVGNLPHQYSIWLARWHNAASALPNGVMPIEPFVYVRKLQTDRRAPASAVTRTITMEAPYRITPAGRIVMSRALVRAAKAGDLEMAVRWSVKVPPAVLAAYDIRAVFAPGNSVPATCIAGTGYVECAFDLAVDRSADTAALTLEVIPRAPKWLAEAIPNRTHAGAKSLATFVTTSTFRPRFTFNVTSQRKMAVHEVLTIDFRQ